jgi:hypothetical protein
MTIATSGFARYWVGIHIRFGCYSQLSVKNNCLSLTTLTSDKLEEHFNAHRV